MLSSANNEILFVLHQAKAGYHSQPIKNISINPLIIHLAPFFDELLQQEKPHATLQTGSTWLQLFLTVHVLKLPTMLSYKSCSMDSLICLQEVRVKGVMLANLVEYSACNHGCIMTSMAGTK